MISNQNSGPDLDDGHDANRDPITGAPGAHPVGVGIGGAAGGAMAGAAAGTIFGPLGTLVGAAIGVVAGAAVGKGVAERLDPTAETAYWRDAHRERPYVKPEYDYDRDYAAAYGFGLQAREGQDGRDGAARDWESSENTLKQQWQDARGESRLEWDDARDAVKDAWNRADASHRTYAASDAYYEPRHDDMPYREDDGTTFADYRPAYRYGAQARSMYNDRDWDDDMEKTLRSDWDSRRGESTLSWERARDAVREAFTSHDQYNRSADANRADNDHFEVR